MMDLTNSEIQKYILKFTYDENEINVLTDRLINGKTWDDMFSTLDLSDRKRKKLIHHYYLVINNFNEFINGNRYSG